MSAPTVYLNGTPQSDVVSWSVEGGFVRRFEKGPDGKRVRAESGDHWEIETVHGVVVVR